DVDKEPEIKNVGKTAFSFRHFPTFYNRHLHMTLFKLLSFFIDYFIVATFCSTFLVCVTTI
ncbi:hypothetical protein NVQ97_13085, partial [Staphylococcus pseudintermedius]|nr:hypothetical protein [Staphylococcus pseudintermedius]